jgi:glycerol-3-phosphate acyltransferase PlsY
MTAGCCFPILVLFHSTTEWSRYNDISVTFIVFSFVIAGVLLWAHRKNIERLKNGTESKIYIWHKPTPPKPEDEKK